ncbi:hypothetical protein [Rhizobium sp. S163]|uniref:hypothetical protein n=1 Tax=Rhizobium sp. S163 TaxID=3055039 RepID=UPI0025A9AC34|nr:hypothetical protein [Rhizobium sp. S163]MDM9644787.1 hypothetical protein [Rhizobium sp. S163]
MIIKVQPVFAPYLDEAIVRFSYLHPGVEIAIEGDGVSLDGDGPELLAAFQHTLYRQKIYRETEGIRLRMLESLL